MVPTDPPALPGGCLVVIIRRSSALSALTETTGMSAIPEDSASVNGDKLRLKLFRLLFHAQMRVHLVGLADKE